MPNIYNPLPPPPPQEKKKKKKRKKRREKHKTGETLCIATLEYQSTKVYSCSMEWLNYRFNVYVKMVTLTL